MSEEEMMKLIEEQKQEIENLKGYKDNYDTLNDKYEQEKKETLKYKEMSMDYFNKIATQNLTFNNTELSKNEEEEIEIPSDKDLLDILS